MEMARDAPASVQGPPRWLVVATIVVTLLSLVMSVAETTLFIHFVVDRGEAISLLGLAFIFVAGLYLHRTRRLRSSLPLVLPWVLYPVVTQGDQLIDNLNINQMRLIVHVILALLFGGPVAVLVLAVTQALAPRDGREPRAPRRWTALVPGLRPIEAGQTREGAAILAATLLVLEMVIAYAFLGALMLVTLAVMTAGVLAYLAAVASNPRFRLIHLSSRDADRLALAGLIAACLVSLGLYVGYKNRPGAYQGSPHYYHDPSQKDATYARDAIAVPAAGGSPLPAELVAGVRAVLSEYGRVLDDLLAAYYVMDRNYNYWFHNELFVRRTPIAAGFRGASLRRIEAAGRRAASADEVLAGLRRELPAGHPLAALAEEAAAYVRFNLRRAAMLERMSEEFQQTKAGLQHATHLYEGEGKAIGAVLADVLAKHQRTLDDSALAEATQPFVETGRRIHDAYANRIVGF